MEIFSQFFFLINFNETLKKIVYAIFHVNLTIIFFCLKKNDFQVI